MGRLSRILKAKFREPTKPAYTIVAEVKEKEAAENANVQLATDVGVLQARIENPPTPTKSDPVVKMPVSNERQSLTETTAPTDWKKLAGVGAAALVGIAMLTGKL